MNKKSIFDDEIYKFKWLEREEYVANSVELRLSVDELCLLLGMLEQSLDSDLSSVPKEFKLTLKSTYQKLNKIAKNIEKGRIQLNE